MARKPTSKPKASPALTVRPVTRATWGDFARLFSARGAPHYCWCTAYRFRDVGEMEGADKERAMHGLVTRGTPVGVLAYAGDEPVGWCSVAPRETYVKLERSRTMPRATAAEVSTWAVLCFFVPRARRGSGVALALLRGAVGYARAQGAKVIEGYPHDTAGISATHRGHSSVFAAAGFVRDGTRWSITDRPSRASRSACSSP